MRILMDCDGVIFDFVGAIIEQTESICGEKVRREDLTQWDFFPQLPLSKKEFLALYGRINSPGFCQSLKMLPGAQEGIEELRAIPGVEIVYVTSPYTSCPTWSYERSNALVSSGLAKNHNAVVHTSAKHLVEGDIFIDDNPDNVYAWLREHEMGSGVIWRAPYNTTAQGFKMSQFWELSNYAKWRLRK